MQLLKTTKKIHLWLGLISGLVVFLVSLSAAIYVFEVEINQLFQLGVYKRSNPTHTESKLHSYLDIEKVVRANCSEEIDAINASIYQSGAWCTVVWVRDVHRKYTAYIIDPYSNEIVNIVENSHSFWSIIKRIHVSLMLPKYGREVVGVSTIIFFIVLISGIFIWRPRRSRHYLKKSLTIKINATFKRLNYDAHRVLGIYSLLPLLFIVLTGLMFAYGSVDRGINMLLPDHKYKSLQREKAIANATLNVNNHLETFNALKRSSQVYISGQ